MPAITEGVRQGAPRAFVAGHDQAVAIAAITQGAGDSLGHPTAATQGERRFLRHGMGLEQLLDGHVVGVVGLEVSVGVDDGVDRRNGRRRSIQLIDQGNAGLLERHRDAATANTEGTNPAHGTR
ncbi:hypothetical protein D3C81_1852050 [compost metagenome]